MVRQNVSGNSPWEAKVGFSRAVRVGNLVFVAGTTATGDDGKLVAPGDAYAQTVQAFTNVERALAKAGASRQDVVRVRMFLTEGAEWDAVSRAYGQFFAAIRPVSTMVRVQALVDPAMLVEVEVDAVVA